MKAKTVSVQGTVYDMKTGQPLRLERSGHGKAKHAHDVHQHTQHSRTLNRRYIKPVSAEAGTPITVHAITHNKKARSARPDTTHSEVRRFSADSREGVLKPLVSKQEIDTIPAQHHPLVGKALQRQAEVSASTHKPAHTSHTPSQVLKKQAIEAATAHMAPRHSKKPVKLKKQRSEHSQRLGLASAALAFMLFSGYLTYLYMPNVSTRVAASQAGVDAAYPSYHPSGYRLSGPIAYQPGEVSMKFAANAGPATYTLTQKRSSWDSGAVREQYIESKTDASVSVSEANGMTIYHYGTSAAWVNGGVLYTIDGDAPLSNEQVTRIATSL